MVRLLQIEFIKLWNNRASRVLIISYFVLLTSIALIASIKFPFGAAVRLADIGIFNFPYIWHFNTFVAAFFKLFLAIVIVSMMANEYSNKRHVAFQCGFKLTAFLGDFNRNTCD